MNKRIIDKGISVFILSLLFISLFFTFISANSSFEEEIDNEIKSSDRGSKLPLFNLEIPETSSRVKTLGISSHDVKKSEIKVIVTLKDPEKIWKSEVSSMNDLDVKNLKTIMRHYVISDLDSKHQFNSFNGFSAILTQEEYDELIDNPLVESISLDKEVKIFMQDTVPLLGASEVWNYQVNGLNLTGYGESVCVIDTGVDYTHPDLGGCVEIYSTTDVTHNISITTPGFPNNYSDDFNGSIGSYTIEGADSIQLFFDSFNTESNFDTIEIYDKNQNLIWWYSGNLGSFWSKSIPGDTIIIKFTSDSSTNYEGVNITKAKGFFHTSECNKIPGGHNFAYGNINPMDVNGHGTHCAGTIGANGNIKGIAPDSKIVAVKSMNDGGDGGFDSDIIAGIEFCISKKDEYNISVISMSLGGGGYNDYCDVQNSILSQIINQAFNKNISVVVATGNDGNLTHISSPACIEKAIRVGSTVKADNTLSTFSNRWALDMLVATGSDINSTYPVAKGSYDELSGTSMATPHVAGAIALMNQYLKSKGESKSPAELNAILKNTAKNISQDSRTYHRINITRAILALDDVEPTLNIIKNDTEIELGNGQINIIWSAVDDLSLDFAIFNITFPNGTLLYQSINATGNITLISPLNLSVSGTYHINLWAIDEAGNQNNITDSFNVVIPESTEINEVIIDDLDDFYSTFPSNDIINILANVSNFDIATDVLYANFSLITTNCGSNGIVNLSLNQIGNDNWNIYNASCYVGDVTQNHDFEGFPVIVLGYRTFNPIPDYKNVSVILYNMTTPPFDTQEGCWALGDKTTDFSKELNFNNINFIYELELNGSAGCYYGDSGLPWGNTLKKVIKLNFTSVNFSDEATISKFEQLEDVINVDVKGPGKHGSSIIDVNTTAFNELNTTTKITIIGLPFSTYPNITGSQGINNITYVLDSGTYPGGFPRGNLTFIANGFSGYIIDDVEEPIIEILYPTNNLIKNNTDISLNFTVNGTGTSISNITVYLNGLEIWQTNHSGIIDETFCSYNALFDFADCSLNLTSNITMSQVYNITILAFDFGGDAPGNMEQESVSFTICVPNIINTSWSNWINETCSSNQRNQSRYLIEYDQNGCGFSNVTHYDYKLVGPEFQNTTWTEWFNISCLQNNIMNQSRQLTEFDFYGCDSNITHYENRTTEFCNFGVAPSIEFVGLNTIYNYSTILLNINSSHIVLDETWYNWNGANITYTQPINITFNEGNQTIYAWANDTANNINFTTISLIVDLTPPNTTDNLNPLWHSSIFSINLNAYDALSGVNYTSYEIGGSWFNGTVININQSGNHTINYYSVDNAGNFENINTIYAPLDLDNPEINQINLSRNIVKTGTLVSINVSAQDSLSGIKVVKVNNNNLTKSGNIWRGNVSLNSTSINVTAFDNANNKITELFDNYTLDNTPPNVTARIKYNGTILNSSLWHNTEVTINITAEDTIGVDKIEWRFENSSSWNLYTSEFNISNNIFDNKIRYRAQDLAGNTANTKILNVKIDRVNPNIENVYLNQNKTIPNQNIILNVETNDELSQIDQIVANLDGTNYTNFVLSNGIYTKEITSPNASGNYTINISVYDLAGNLNTSQTNLRVVENISVIIPSISNNQFVKNLTNINFELINIINGTYNTTSQSNTLLTNFDELSLVINETPFEIKFNVTNGITNTTHNFTYYIDNINPSLVVSNLNNNDVLNGTYRINYDCSDSEVGVRNVEIYINNELILNNSPSVNYYDLETLRLNNSANIKIICYDFADNYNSSNFNLTFNNDDLILELSQVNNEVIFDNTIFENYIEKITNINSTNLSLSLRVLRVPSNVDVPTQIKKNILYLNITASTQADSRVFLKIPKEILEGVDISKIKFWVDHDYTNNFQGPYNVIQYNEDIDYYYFYFDIDRFSQFLIAEEKTSSGGSSGGGVGGGGGGSNNEELESFEFPDIIMPPESEPSIKEIKKETNEFLEEKELDSETIEEIKESDDKEKVKLNLMWVTITSIVLIGLLAHLLISLKKKY